MSNCSLPSSTQSHDQKQAATWRAPEQVAQDGNILSTRSSGFVFLMVGAATLGRPARKPVRSIVDVGRRIPPIYKTLLKGRGNIKVYPWRSFSLRTTWARDQPRGSVGGSWTQDASRCWLRCMELELYEAYNGSLGPVSPHSFPPRPRTTCVTVSSNETMWSRHDGRLCLKLGKRRFAPRIVEQRS